MLWLVSLVLFLFSPFYLRHSQQVKLLDFPPLLLLWEIFVRPPDDLVAQSGTNNLGMSVLVIFCV